MPGKHLINRRISDIMCAVFRVHPWKIYSSIAQSVEHAAVNRAVVGSSPTRGVIRLLGQVVKTPPFHGGNRSSNLLGVIWRRSQVVRQRSATPSSPVQIWSTPLTRD